MRESMIGLSATLLACLAATPAIAQDDTKPVTVTGNATVVSDYRFRGISQTDKNFAVQGSLTLSHASGFYASVWGSTIDEYVAAGSDQEIDLIAGYKKSFGAVTVDVGALYYYYPGAEAFFPGYDSDFIEPYASISGAIGPVTAKVSAAYAPKQDAMLNVDNLYGAVDLSGAIPDTGVSLSAHLGHNFMDDSLLALGKKYTDWSVGASYSWKNLTFGVSYVDTNFDKGALSLLSPTGKDIAKAGVVGSIGVSF